VSRLACRVALAGVLALAGPAMAVAACPGTGESCATGTHGCCPAILLDCVRSDQAGTCGTNHIWLHVQHNRLSLPMAATEGACDFRFASLDEAKWACQGNADCIGITQDHGKECGGAKTTFELRRGVLWDTNPDQTFVSWVKKVFVRYEGTDLTERFAASGGDGCAHRHADLEAAELACKLEQGCVGVVQLAEESCGDLRLPYELRRGGQVAAEGRVSWIMQPTSSAN